MLRRWTMLLACLFVTLSAFGQATRTWVSGVGDDANPCSRTAPCKTFVGAMVRTNLGGEINCVTSGGFGPVIINKSITIDGTGCFAAILAGNLNGINIFITAQADAAKTVRLRGLSINGIGTGLNGIKVTAAHKVFIENGRYHGDRIVARLLGQRAPAEPKLGAELDA